MVGRPPLAVVVALDAGAKSRASASRALRRLGFVTLLAGVHWAVTRGGRPPIREVSVALRRALRGEPFVAVIFMARVPWGDNVYWLTQRGD